MTNSFIDYTKSTHFPGIFANALYARATGSIWAPEFEAFASHSCLLVILSVYTMKPNPNCAYSDEDSSIISGNDGGKKTTGFIVLATRSCFLIDKVSKNESDLDVNR